MREKHPDGESACGYCLAGEICIHFNAATFFKLYHLITVSSLALNLTIRTIFELYRKIVYETV